MSALKKRVCAVTLTAGILASSMLPLNTVLAADHDYATALKYSIEFYDANKCGKDVGLDNVFSWRGPCHTTDGSDISLDLTGGFHDAGDHVKFGITEGYAASVLQWSYFEFKGSFDKAGTSKKMLSELKYFTDYFLKCHPDANTFYYQCGDGDADHAEWCSPENQKSARPTRGVANLNKPASDVLGETAAALALMYLNYKSIDSTYASSCLKAAKELYTLGTTRQGCGDGQSYYVSGSYYDDLAWAATWLYTADGNSKYLDDAKDYLARKNPGTINHNWAMCWDDMCVPTIMRLADLTGDQKYKDAMNSHLNYWKNDIRKTPAGLKYPNSWGVLRYDAAEAMVALAYYKRTKDESLKTFAKSQIDYICGSNPANMSYIIGFGTNWPKHPHHRAANGYTYEGYGNLKEAKNLLRGALVGGPNENDVYCDQGDKYEYTEVAIDYNAGLVGALAGMIYDGSDTPIEDWLGDINDDKSINVVDATILKSVVIKKKDASIFKKPENADMNGDKVVNSLDYLLLKQKIQKMVK